MIESTDIELIPLQREIVAGDRFGDLLEIWNFCFEHQYCIQTPNFTLQNLYNTLVFQFSMFLIADRIVILKIHSHSFKKS
jgi:hypothetical protein